MIPEITQSFTVGFKLQIGRFYVPCETRKGIGVTYFTTDAVIMSAFIDLL